MSDYSNYTYSMHASIFAFLATPVSAMALCLNPFGCEPKTEAECVREAASAKTDAIAKALIAECRNLPGVTLSQCNVAEGRWAEHVASRASHRLAELTGNRSNMRSSVSSRPGWRSQDRRSATSR